MNMPQLKIPEILKLLQILYQNDEISTEKKNHLVSLLNEARKTNDFSEFNKAIHVLAYASTMTETIDRLLEITSH